MSKISWENNSSSYSSSRTQISEDDSIPLTIDLVSAARRTLKFLRYVSYSHHSLYHPPTLLHSIRRYEELWMPMMADLINGSDPYPPMILPPLDIEWVWFCHSLNPVQYREYCKRRFSKVIGKATIFDEENEEYAINRCREIWRSRYPDQVFDQNEAGDFIDMGWENYTKTTNREENEGIIVCEVRKQKGLYEKLFGEAYMEEKVYLLAARRRYKKWLLLMLKTREDGFTSFIPTIDILLIWITHQSYPTVYAADTQHMGEQLLTKVVVGPWDHSVKQQQEDIIEESKKLWEANFDEPYERAGGYLHGGIINNNNNAFPFQTPFSESDVNIIYKSLQPRYLLEVCIHLRLIPHTDATQLEKTRQFLRLQMLRSHRELKLEKPISRIPSNSCQKEWHFYCEFGTKGIMLELHRPGNLCFSSAASSLDTVSITWNHLLRAHSLAITTEIDHKIRVFTSITPPVQAPYLLKCVPDRITDDSGAMISDVMLKLNKYRPQEGRWLSRTGLDHAGRECFVVRIRVGEGFWRRGGETPETVKWEDRVIEIREGPWSYVAGSAIGTAPEKVVATAKPKEESKDQKGVSWLFSMGYELTVQWEGGSSSLDAMTLSLMSNNQDYSPVKLLKGRQMQYQVIEDKRVCKTERVSKEEEEFVTVVRYSDENPNGKATALLNWKLLAMEVLPEEDAVLLLLLGVAILRSVTETRKEDIGGLLIRRRLKETKLGIRDWGSIVLHPSSCPQSPSPYVQPWYWNAKATLAQDHSFEHTLSPPAVLSGSLAEGGDKLYKKGVIT